MSGDAEMFIRRLVGAWDCCGTCAGGVLAAHDAAIRADAWDEGATKRGHYRDDVHDLNPYRAAQPTEGES